MTTNSHYCPLMFVFIMIIIYPYVHGGMQRKRTTGIENDFQCLECSLDCGSHGGRCLQTKMPDMSEICSCPDGTYSNSTCLDVADGQENNVTSINIHGLLFSEAKLSIYFVLLQLDDYQLSVNIHFVVIQAFVLLLIQRSDVFVPMVPSQIDVRQIRITLLVSIIVWRIKEDFTDDFSLLLCWWMFE